MHVYTVIQWFSDAVMRWCGAWFSTVILVVRNVKRVYHLIKWIYTVNNKTFLSTSKDNMFTSLVAGHTWSTYAQWAIFCIIIYMLKHTIMWYSWCSNIANAPLWLLSTSHQKVEEVAVVHVLLLSNQYGTYYCHMPVLWTTILQQGYLLVSHIASWWLLSKFGDSDQMNQYKAC